jgi:hypothetical protein
VAPAVVSAVSNSANPGELPPVLPLVEGGGWRVAGTRGAPTQNTHE